MHELIGAHARNRRSSCTIPVCRSEGEVPVRGAVLGEDGGEGGFEERSGFVLVGFE